MLYHLTAIISRRDRKDWRDTTFLVRSKFEFLVNILGNWTLSINLQRAQVKTAMFYTFYYYPPVDPVDINTTTRPCFQLQA